MDGTYAFPWYLNTGPLFYNKSLFEKAGLDPEQPPKTYDEVFDAALKIADKTDGKVATLANVPTIEDFGRYGVLLMNKEGAPPSRSTTPRACSSSPATRSCTTPRPSTRRR